MSDHPRRHLDDRRAQQRWLDPRLRSLRVTEIEAYLRSHGWEQAKAAIPGVTVFKEPDEEAEGPLYQWVPQNEGSRDYLQGIYMLLAGIADAEGRSAGEVLDEMLAQDRRPRLNGDARHSVALLP